MAFNPGPMPAPAPKRGLSTGAILGIVGGAVALLIVLAAALATVGNLDANKSDGAAIKSIDVDANLSNGDADAANEVVVGVRAFTSTFDYELTRFDANLTIAIHVGSADNTTWTLTHTTQRDVHAADFSAYYGDLLVQTQLDSNLFEDGQTYRIQVTARMDGTGATFEDIQTLQYFEIGSPYDY